MKVKLLILLIVVCNGMTNAQELTGFCDEKIFLSGLEQNISYLYWAKNRIVVEDNYMIPTNSQSDISMKAGKMIVLKPKTSVLKGNKYLAKIEACKKPPCVNTFAYSKFFTPNGDAINNVWRVKDLDEASFGELYIFDRYGKIVHKMSNIYSGWDGTYNNVSLPATDYWFKLVFKDCNNEWAEYKSHFSLMR
jgi:gliding motility-associated-like protein